VHENGTDKEKMADSRCRGASRKMHRTFSIDHVVGIGRVFFVRLMDARGEMHYRLNTIERSSPIGRPSDRIDQNLVVVPQ
jgi:hypothetical protein